MASAPDSAAMARHRDGDVGQRLVPAHANELPLAFRSRPLQRVQDAIGMVDALEIVIHLGAQRAAGERMRGSPDSRSAVPSRTSTTQLQVSGQSCPHAPRTICSGLDGDVIDFLWLERVDRRPQPSRGVEWYDTRWTGSSKGPDPILWRMP